MSKQLRDAYSVWTEAFGAWNNNPESVGASEDAAAIIEADRQATRAALMAEIVAWLRDGEKEFSDCDIAAHLLETGMWKQ